MFNQAEIDLVQNIVNQLSQAMERWNLFNEARLQAERMARLAELTSELNRPLTVEEVVNGIGQAAMVLGFSERAAVYIRNPNDTVLCVWRQGISLDYVDQVVSQIRSLPGERLLYHPDPVLINDTLQLPNGSLLKKLSQEEKFRSLALWPLLYEGTVMAFVGLYYYEPRAWTDAEREILLAFTRQAAVALQNARLFNETSKNQSPRIVSAPASPAHSVKTFFRYCRLA